MQKFVSSDAPQRCSAALPAFFLMHSKLSRDAQQLGNWRVSRLSCGLFRHKQAGKQTNWLLQHASCELELCTRALVLSCDLLGCLEQTDDAGCAAVFETRHHKVNFPDQQPNMKTISSWMSVTTGHEALRQSITIGTMPADEVHFLPMT